jgi:hypothetical protein
MKTAGTTTTETTTTKRQQQQHQLRLKQHLTEIRILFSETTKCKEESRSKTKAKQLFKKFGSGKTKTQ